MEYNPNNYYLQDSSQDVASRYEDLYALTGIVDGTDFSEHPIHPPKDLHNDPWDCEFLDDCGYIPSIVDGVYQLFANEDDLKAGKRYFLSLKHAKNMEVLTKTTILFQDRIRVSGLERVCHRHDPSMCAHR